MSKSKLVQIQITVHEEDVTELLDYAASLVEWREQQQDSNSRKAIQQEILESHLTPSERIKWQAIMARQKLLKR